MVQITALFLILLKYVTMNLQFSNIFFHKKHMDAVPTVIIQTGRKAKRFLDPLAPLPKPSDLVQDHLPRTAFTIGVILPKPSLHNFIHISVCV